MSADGKLKVVQIGKFYPPHVGGIESHVATLCRELRTTANLHTLVANDGGRDEEELVDGVRVSRLAAPISIAGAPVCPKMIAELRRSRADIVHVHLPNPAGVLAIMMGRCGGRLVATWHSDVVRQRRLARIYTPLERRFLRKCAAIIATSPNYVESSPELARFRDRCHVIPYGIELDPLRAPAGEQVKSIRDRYGSPLLLAVGRLVYYKGFEFLVRAMQQVNATLVIVGAGPLRDRLEREARELGVAARVRFLGEMQLQEIAPYYHACDVFVLPSIARSEAFGIVQLEAMACGKPVVNTQIASGVPFASRDGETGITVPPASAAALGAAIERLLGDPGLRVKFGRAGRARVEREFTSRTMADRTRELYARVMSAEGSRRPAVTSSAQATARLRA